MSQPSAMKPDYRNWVSPRLLYVAGAGSVVFAGLSFLVPWFAILAVICGASCAYFAYARYQFSSRGGDLQPKVQALLLDGFEWDGEGKAIDIGCGSGALSITMAIKYPDAQVTGVDFWGGSWEYSKDVCDCNAEIEGVGDRVAFQQGTASSLPFDDGSFDAAVSNLTFHEVRDVKDKRLLIKEALRVVKKGGAFAFQDLFLWKQVYGDVDDLLAAIRSWGVERVEFIDTSSSPFIPRALKLPFMLGTIGVLRGTK
ncbi:MAG: class I SAM-dependent methyltransferase [Chloroflexi bacterium]|nr:class I SAM-dependent methyltransferase [Chloroflexota bacterium]